MKKAYSILFPCPFHEEKTPSFATNEVMDYYHCFGCGRQGVLTELIESSPDEEFNAQKLDFIRKNVHVEKNL